MEKFSKTIGMNAESWQMCERLQILLDQKDLAMTLQTLIKDRWEIQKLVRPEQYKNYS
jgi:hypothetical protein